MLHVKGLSPVRGTLNPERLRTAGLVSVISTPGKFMEQAIKESISKYLKENKGVAPTLRCRVDSPRGHKSGFTLIKCIDTK